jgi:hypothetical protein
VLIYKIYKSSLSSSAALQPHVGLALLKIHKIEAINAII